MKVRITFDISDDERVAISAHQDGEFRAASREEIVEFIDAIVYSRLRSLGTSYREAMDEIVARLKV